MPKTEVYQIRLDSTEKQQAFEVFKQLGLTPAQAVRLFFRQVVLTQSIPFNIQQKIQLHTTAKNSDEENHADIFHELDHLLNLKK